MLTLNFFFCTTSCRHILFHGLVESFCFILNLERLADFLAKNDRLSIINQALDVVILCFGRGASATLGLVVIVMFSLVQVVLSFLNLLLDLIDSFVGSHQLVCLLNLILFFLEVSVRVVNLIFQTHKLGLFFGKSGFNFKIA